MKIEVDNLDNYLIATLENAQAHASEQPQLMYMVYEMERIFRHEIFNHKIDADPAAGLLAMHAYMMLVSSVRQALSGHSVSVFPAIRVALESACYAYLIARDEKMGRIWLERHLSRSALDRCRKSFTVKNAVGKLKTVSPEMAEYVMAHYDASIDFGAHPNQRSVFNHLVDIGQVGDKYHGFELTGVYGENSWEVNHALLVCVEVGQAIGFLIAASADNHPLIYERLDVFQSWMDEKNRMADELNGGPIDYKGPMYSSVISPVRGSRNR
ncbi:hypothetical protein [Aeromonas rivipollensis]|uniref:hypothetical protein n=1 Tax=Aeromonas rivipollensis TaxID=948519 RepID=UPI0029784736|nr:hypothetical protein [Aeromonas rivipollensis]